GSLQQCIELRTLVAPFGATDASIFVDAHNRVAGPFGPGLKLFSLGFGVLCICAHAHIDGDPFRLRHVMSPTNQQTTIAERFNGESKVYVLQGCWKGRGRAGQDRWSARRYGQARGRRDRARTSAVKSVRAMLRQRLPPRSV